MILGFTGTRQGLTPAQRVALPGVLATLPERVLHGGAVGADTEFQNFLMSQPLSCAVAVEIYPATRVSQQTWFKKKHQVFPSGRELLIHLVVFDPLVRNRIMTRRCDHLLACPAEATEQRRSGTWATVRYARAAGKPITIIAPDGTILEERR